jgi:hypothetical protein
MLAIAVTYGLISGSIIIASIIAGLAFGATGGHLLSSPWLGYLIMLLALLLVFFGVKRYRDRDLGGVIRFGRAFGVGICIVLVASAVYVVVWEAYLALTGYDFMADYARTIIEQRTAAGATPEEIEAETRALEEMAASYANPLFRIPVTFTEIFPVGLIVALVSAALLRNPNFAPARA